MSGPTYNNRKARFAGGPITMSKKLSHRQRAEARRQVMPGFPVTEKFLTHEEVHEYLSGDRITCLRCGKSYRSLGNHLRVHGWTEEQYREFYGLPWTIGLSCRGTREKHRVAGRKNVEKGVAFGGVIGDPEVIKKAHKAPRRRRQPYRNDTAEKNLSHVEHQKFFKDEDYRAIIGLLDAGHTLPEIYAMDGLPSGTAIRKYRREHKNFDKAVRGAIERQPFSVQSRGQALGKRFRREVERLIAAGKTNAEIGELLGVHAHTVMSVSKHMSRPEITHCPAGHEYPAGTRRCKICNTEHQRRRRGHLPREVAAKTLVKVACVSCGKVIERSRLAGGRDVKCGECKAEVHRQIQKRWGDRYREDQREYRAAHYAMQRGDFSLMQAYIEAHPNGRAAKRLSDKLKAEG